ncbi:hypothetical protein [Streptomyces sp. SP18CS02]|uniref:hypothetical protein n=1 Tax=Streptomyces sp. SP18CS02 TaxID=3002531 RepID=UPI002E76C163|nr:hypothetical protein [Streptomyces sp. SP18CS02]
MRAPDGALWTADHNGSWSGAQKIPGATPQEAAAATAWNNKIYVMYRRPVS